MLLSIQIDELQLIMRADPVAQVIEEFDDGLGLLPRPEPGIANGIVMAKPGDMVSSCFASSALRRFLLGAFIGFLEPVRFAIDSEDFGMMDGRSMRDATQAAFGNTSFHSANGRLVVIIAERSA